MAGAPPIPTLGMIGTGVWSNDERPKSYREGILKLMPNGDTPLTAITAKGRSERTTDPEFKWFIRDLSKQGGSLEGSGVYTNLSGTAHTGSGNNLKGTVLYARMKEEVAKNFKKGHTAILSVYDDDTKRSDLSKMVFVHVRERHLQGDTSHLTLRLGEDTVAADLEDMNYIDIVGTSFPEGDSIGESVHYRPNVFNNLTQIWRTPLSITRTQKHTKLRTGDAYLDMKANALLYHGIEMEMSTIFGVKDEFTGDNGEKQRTTDGILSFIRQFAPDNERDFSADSELSWLQGGEDWIDENLEQLFRYGRTTKLGLAGPRAVLGIQRLVKLTGQFQFIPTTASYGIQVMRWVTPFGEIMIKIHPLFSHKPLYRSMILLLEPENMKFRYITDTMFKKGAHKESEAGFDGYDATKEEYLTEGGYELHFPETFALWNGLGQDPDSDE